MGKPIRVEGELIYGLEDQLSALEAICELADNSLDAGASHIEVTVSSGSMSIIDNGHGVDDINSITTPGKSSSRHSIDKIGVKGIGGCQAMATFGRSWDIHTVKHSAKHLYYHHKAIWNPRGHLPDRFEGTSRPIHYAPKEIRNGGTKIVVTGRQPGRGRVRPETVCKELEKIYRHALNNGLSILIHFPEVGFRKKLTNIVADKSRFVSPIEVLNAEVHNRPFTVRYGQLKETDKSLSGCHVIFGPRVISTVDVIGNMTLPPTCYIDVILDNTHNVWKPLLGTNKKSFAFCEELFTELESILGGWIKQQKDQATSFRMKITAGKVSDRFNDTVEFLNENTPGDYGKKSRDKILREKPEHPLPGPGPRPKPDHSRRSRAQKGGSFGIEKDDRNSCLKMDIKFSEALGKYLYKVTFAPGLVEVTFNTGENQREIREYFERQKVDDLFSLAVVAYAHTAAINKEKFGSTFAALRAQGYDLDEDSDSRDIVSQLSNFFIDHAYGRKGSIKNVA